jgi:uncharacterized protein (TIGR02246 family)
MRGSRRQGGAPYAVGMTSVTDMSGVERLHGEILDAWNRQDADGYASRFADDALVVGFDGSEMNGVGEITEQLAEVFADHQVARYVRVLRGVWRVGTDTALLHAVVGMIPPGGDDVMPDRHAVQVLVAVREGDAWRARSLQNTPAELHGQPEAVEALTVELREAAAQAV